jgi:Ni,Fe-hydrogenase III large subunit/Ni,Fe-hydrogenase III component G
MSALTQLIQRLAADRLVSDALVRRSHEVHCRVEADAIVRLAERVCGELEADLLMIAAEDRREHAGCWVVHYVFGHAQPRWVLHAAVTVLDVPGPALPSLAPYHYAASRFEREIRDQFGISFDGHPDPRPLVRHAFWPEDYHPLRRREPARDGFSDDGRPFPFMPVGGEGVYEIPVGPVHAGVIEPGHFRFSVLGETIITMKSRLYFTHKGTEKLFEGRTPAGGVELAERISGDTSVGHALAYAQAIESATSTIVPARARYLRVVLLELERLYNHVGDFGAIANDTGFAVAHAHCYRIRETLLRLNKELTGARLLRGLVVPGGLTRDLPPRIEILERLHGALVDFEEVADLCLQNTMVADRLEGTGVLDREAAATYGALGYVGRASGLDADVRRDLPFAAYDELRFTVPVLTTGDVKARTLIRLEEIRQSLALIRQAWATKPEGAVSAPLGRAVPFEAAFGIVEGWRGRLVHLVVMNAEGTLHRLKVVDPSFFNWPALTRALADTIVPDFPLCNKSFNQSYSGHDL